jgi:hypothetical protein
MPRIQTLIAVALSVLVLSSTANSGAIHASEEAERGNPNVFGIAAHAWWLDPEVYGDQLFPALDDLGVTTVRIGIDWKRFEPEQGQYDWSKYDRVLGELARRNVVIIANFNTIPAWASVDEAGCAIEVREIYDCELRDDMYPEFEQAIQEAVSRYHWIERWEFWNEPEMWTHFRDLAYLEYLRTFYDVVKEINPELDVAASTLAGAEYIRWLYNVSQDWYGEGNAPWDVVAYHPYGQHDANVAALDHVDPINYDAVMELHELMVERGHEDGRIWITEYGWYGDPAAKGGALVQTLDWLKEQPFIEFAHLHMLHDWYEGESHEDRGLMAIVPDESGNEVLDENTRFTPKGPFYNAFRDYPRGGLPEPPDDPEVRYFPETGQVVSGRFLDFWEQHGGLRTIGLPLTRRYARELDDGSWLLVQDFERMRLEYHFEHRGTEYEVLGTLIGNQVTADRGDEPEFQSPDECVPNESRVCFEATGHSLSGVFRDFWQEHGGLARFGYPISREFEEMNPDTGEIHLVQYFERARFEHHPDLRDTGFEVQLGLLIRDDLESQGWIPADDPRLPTRRQFE